MDNYTFGHKRKKIQWRANLPVILSVVAVLGLGYVAVSVMIEQLKPKAEPLSTITITRNTPSASELNLSAPLVDYHPNKDECQEEKLSNEETDEQRDKRLAECKEKKEKEEKEKKESEVAEGEATEVLGEQEEKPSFMEVFAKVIGASAAKNNSDKSMAAESNKTEEDLAGGADGSENKVDDGVGENADN